MKKKLTSFLPWKNIWQRYRNIIDTIPNISCYSYGQRIIVQGIVSEYAFINWKQTWEYFTKIRNENPLTYKECFRNACKDAIEVNIIMVLGDAIF